MSTLSAELLAAVYHAVAHGVDLVIALDAALDGIGEQVEDGLDGCEVVDVAELVDGLAAVGRLVLEETVGKADLFDAAFGECFGF